MCQQNDICSVGGGGGGGGGGGSGPLPLSGSAHGWASQKSIRF